MSDPDVTPQDALAIAQRALAKVNDLEDELERADAEIDDLAERVTALELRLSELDDGRDASELSQDEKIGKVREYAFNEAADGHGKTRLDYRDIELDVFNGEIGTSTAYRLIRRAAGLTDEKTGSNVAGFRARDPSNGNYHLAVDAAEAKQGAVFSGGKIGSGEGRA